MNPIVTRPQPHHLGSATKPRDPREDTTAVVAMATIREEPKMPTTMLHQDVQYLDLDGDGLPDAVLIRETLTTDTPAGPAPLETIETLETGIGIDGVPHHIEVHAEDG